MPAHFTTLHAAPFARRTRLAGEEKERLFRLAHTKIAPEETAKKPQKREKATANRHARAADEKVARRKSDGGTGDSPSPHRKRLSP